MVMALASDFPYFYVLTKTMFEKKHRGKKLSAKETKMLEAVSTVVMLFMASCF